MANHASLSARIQTNSLTRYGAALVETAGALLIARSLSPLMGEGSFYVAAYPAIAVSAWYCGLGPSVAATVLTLVGLKYWFMTPAHTFATTTFKEAFGITMFLAAAALIVAVGEVRRRENRALRKG